MTNIKFCGLTTLADAQNAERHGAAFLGVILASGPRLVSAAQAKVVLGDKRAGIRRVGVFGNQSNTDICRLTKDIDLDVIQLHGDPPAEQVRQLQVLTHQPIWPVLRLDGTTLPPETQELAEMTGVLVLDAKSVGQLGGTGVQLNWSGLQDDVAALRRNIPHVQIVLAGGLRPGNVAEAIALLTPDVVDVSSGVEVSPGRKDPELVVQFVSAVRTATEVVR